MKLNSVDLSVFPSQHSPKLMLPSNSGWYGQKTNSWVKWPSSPIFTWNKTNRGSTTDNYIIFNTIQSWHSLWSEEDGPRGWSPTKKALNCTTSSSSYRHLKTGPTNTEEDNTTHIAEIPVVYWPSGTLIWACAHVLYHCKWMLDYWIYKINHLKSSP